jgi:ATP-dependent exoDNAse (exonuclease V) alpha subunit
LKEGVYMHDNATYFNFPLRPQQKDAFEALQKFVRNQSEKIFILKGYAGTGKTTLLGGFIKWLGQSEHIYALLASTGRAAKVLSDKTNSESRTIHSLIYIFKDIDDDLEQMSAQQNKFSVDDKGQISLMFELKKIISESNKLYIIDEASMVADINKGSNSFAKFGSGELLKDLLSYDENGKFIFVGDPIQLPPIGQVISPALSKVYIENNYSINATQIELTDVIRQSSSNGIIKASMMIRMLHNRNPKVKFASFPLKGHSNIELHNSHASLISEYIQKIKNYGFEYSTLICQTNRHCSDLNKIIRSSLGKNSNLIENGDILLVTQNNYLTRLVNGDIIQVVQTGKKEHRCGLSFLQVEVQELVSKNKYNVLLIEDILYSITTNLNNQQHKNLMIDYYHRMKDKGIHQKDKGFKDGMLTDPYLNALKSVYGYALTCHKSQGGEWDEVFLYLDNKIHGIPKPSIYQWLYTAVTRAKETLHVVNDWFIK